MILLLKLRVTVQKCLLSAIRQHSYDLQERRRKEIENFKYKYAFKLHIFAMKY